MGYGGLDDRKNSNEYNYLLPTNEIDLDSLNNNLDRIHRLIKLELLSYDELENTIEQELKLIINNEQEPAIILHTDKSVAIEHVVKVMDIAYRNKYKIVLATTPH